MAATFSPGQIPTGLPGLAEVRKKNSLLLFHYNEKFLPLVLHLYEGGEVRG